MGERKTIQVKGLKELRSTLRGIDKELGPELRKGLNEVAEIVLDTARPLVPTRTGKARASLKAGSTEKAVQIKAGGAKVGYWGWLDFGGSVGKGRKGGGKKAPTAPGSVKRPFIMGGRYIYPTMARKRDEIEEKFYEVIDRVTAGLR